jgi:GT2 family glycosyltransferase
MNSPAFSVIIPTYNRPARLRACLESFHLLQYPEGEWELIVVNDGGDHSFSKLGESIGDELPLRLIEQEHGGPASARNLGAQNASGAYLAFTDDDCRVTSNWLNEFESGFQRRLWHGLGGQTVNPYPENATARAMQFFTDFLYEYLRMPNDDAYMLISNNAAIQRNIYLKEGGFDESFPYAAAEDRELSHRLNAKGYRLHYWPKAKVWHHHQVSARGYLSLQFRYGKGDYYFRRAIIRKEIPLQIGQRRRPRFHVQLARKLLEERASLYTWCLLYTAQATHQFGSMVGTFAEI